jgi:hypothetical protein
MEFRQAAVIGIIKSALDTRDQEQLDISLHEKGGAARCTMTGAMKKRNSKRRGEHHCWVSSTA